MELQPQLVDGTWELAPDMQLGAELEQQDKRFDLPFEADKTNKVAFVVA